MKSAFLRRFKRDETAMKDGRWFKHTEDETIEVLVRPESATDVRDFAASQVRSQRKLLVKHKGVLPAVLSDENDVDLCVKKLLRGWKGIDDANGMPVPFNADTARHYLTKYPEFREWILSLARDPENFGEPDAASTEEMVGNSSKSSSGDSPTESTSTPTPQ